MFSPRDELSAVASDGTVVAIVGREVVEVRLGAGEAFRVSPGVSMLPDGRSRFMFSDGTGVRDAETRDRVLDDDLRLQICRLAAAGLGSLDGAVVDWMED